MASTAESPVVNLAVLVQGITLVTLPQPVRSSSTQRVRPAVAARHASPPELHPRPAGHEQPADLREARPDAR